MRVNDDFDVVAMLTMADQTAERSRSHGLRPEVIDAHADLLGIRRLVGRCTWATYDEEFGRLLERVKLDGVTHIIFGDILFPEHRAWAERMCNAHGLTAVEPLFGSATDTLLLEWVDSGSEALIVTARAEHLDESWLGRTLSRGMLDEFRNIAVDPCGERGEYHTVVTSCPLFRRPLRLAAGDVVFRSGCWALDVTVV